MPVSCRGVEWTGSTFKQLREGLATESKVFCKHTQSVANAIPGLCAVEF